MLRSASLREPMASVASSAEDREREDEAPPVACSLPRKRRASSMSPSKVSAANVISKSGVILAR
jgi:hypothetical protein